MTNQQIKHQSQILLAHGLDAAGKLQPKMVVAIAKAVAESSWPHKRALLRQLLRDVTRIEAQQTALVSSAKALSHEEQQSVIKVIQQKHAQVGEFRWQVQPELLAGLTIKVGDTWYDYSVQQRLLQVQEQLG